MRPSANDTSSPPVGVTSRQKESSGRVAETGGTGLGSVNADMIDNDGDASLTVLRCPATTAVVCQQGFGVPGKGFVLTGRWHTTGERSSVPSPMTVLHSPAGGAACLASEPVVAACSPAGGVVSGEKPAVGSVSPHASGPPPGFDVPMFSVEVYHPPNAKGDSSAESPDVRAPGVPGLPMRGTCCIWGKQMPL